jgi:hypothetical protein
MHTNMRSNSLLKKYQGDLIMSRTSGSLGMQQMCCNCKLLVPRAF